MKSAIDSIPPAAPPFAQPTSSPSSQVSVTKKNFESAGGKGRRLNENLHVTFSQPVFRPGKTIVGTVQVFDDDDRGSLKSSQSSSKRKIRIADSLVPSTQWKSLSLCVVGYCRLDSRWHKNSNYLETYAIHDQNDGQNRNQLFEALRNLPADLPDRHRVFWSAYSKEGPAVELLRVAENQTDDVALWKDLRPRPIRYTDDWADQLDQSSALNENSESTMSVLSITGPDHRQHRLAFTFRADLPKHLPSTLSMAVSCRYSYALLLRLRTQSGSVHWMEAPIVVQKSVGGSSHNQCYGHLYSPSALSVKAHSGGLPCYLSATELNGASPKYQKGSLTVHRFSAAYHVNATPGPVLRITDPFAGKPVSILTVLAPTETNSDMDDSESDVSALSQAICLHPGSRLYLQFDFPARNSLVTDEWVPCYQISACLQGEESVLAYSSTYAALSHGSELPHESEHEKARRTRAQQLLLSTAHEVLDPETTQRISLCLIVPENSICSVKTCAVEITYECIVDIVVAQPSSSNNNYDSKTHPKHRNLRLQMPCIIDQPQTAAETMASDTHDTEENAFLQRQRALWVAKIKNRDQNPATTTNGHVQDTSVAFPTEDIWDDLKRLSIVMAEENGCTPSTAPTAL
ncbi:hypothetical protein ACA910_005774 [Epithemia clementina (nom. ined.)]